MKKVSIYISESELLALEDILVAWPLCQKHKMETLNASDIETYAIQYKCKNCQKIKRKWREGAWNVMSKLFTAYDKDKKR